MTRRKRRRRPPALVPRRGPANNLRPAGAHESLKRYNRKRLKTALRQELAEGGFPFFRRFNDSERNPRTWRRGSRGAQRR